MHLKMANSLMDSGVLASSKNLTPYSFKNHSTCYLIKSPFFMGSFSIPSSVATRAHNFLDSSAIKKHVKAWNRLTKQNR